MKLSTITLVLVLSVFTCSAELTRQECVDQGGVVVGDIGDGAIFEEGYVCPTDGLPPIDVVVAGPAEPMAIEGEVCCGGGSTNPDGFFRPEINADECAEQGGMIVNDIGDGSIHREDYLCEDTGVPPIGTVIPREGEPIAREGQVCCPVPNNSTSQREEYTREQCLANNGTVVGDIGDGAIFQEGYVCESSGLPPLGNIVQSEEPFAVEGEVCCEGGWNMTLPAARGAITRDECESKGGEVVGDIGDGAIFGDSYVCDSNGLPPIADIIQDEEPFAIEGEVCCGAGLNVTLPVIVRDEITRDECLANNGTIVGDIGDGAIFQEGYVCESSGLPPLGNIIQGEEPFAIEGEVCCEGGWNMTLPAAMEAITREECSSQGGTIVGDIGNGAIFEDTYTCESNGLPPIANIIQSEEPFAIEGEVCCGEAVNQTFTSARDEISRAECEAQGGEIVGDIGDGAVFADTYVCESNGQAPLANIVADNSNDEPIATEGEVCCGSPDSRNEILDASQVNDADGASNLSLLCVISLIAGLFWIV